MKEMQFGATSEQVSISLWHDFLDQGMTHFQPANDDQVIKMLIK